MKIDRLYNYWRSSSSWRVRIALAHKGLDYEYVSVHLVDEGGKQNEDWFKAMNPMAQVPVLEFTHHDQTVHLGQSMAILEFLEEMVPQPALLPHDPLLRARARQMAEIINAGTQPLQNLKVIQRLRDEMGADWKGWCQDAIMSGLASFEAMARLSEGDDERSALFSVGERPSFADLCLIPQLYNARRFSCDLSGFTRILAIEERCNELEAFQLSHPDRQPDAATSGP